MYVRDVLLQPNNNMAYPPTRAHSFSKVELPVIYNSRRCFICGTVSGQMAGKQIRKKVPVYSDAHFIAITHTEVVLRWTCYKCIETYTGALSLIDVGGLTLIEIHP